MYSCTTAQQLLGEGGVRKYSQAHRNGNAVNWIKHEKMPAGEFYKILYKLMSVFSLF